MSNTEKSIPILGYWNIRGNAQPIRLLLAYTKTAYEEKTYNWGKHAVDRTVWYSEKYTLDLDFPNLPYYIEGDLRLTQSLTILQHLARKHDLVGKDDKQRRRIDLVEQQLRDYRNLFIDATLDSNFEKARLVYLGKLPEILKSLSTFLSERPYFTGNSISYVDFMAYEYIDQHYYLYQELFRAENRNLVEFLRRIESLPTIYDYQHSPNYIRWPSGLLIPWYESKFYSTFNRSVSDKPTDQLNELVKKEMAQKSY